MSVDNFILFLELETITTSLIWTQQIHRLIFWQTCYGKILAIICVTVEKENC